MSIMQGTFLSYLTLYGNDVCVAILKMWKLRVRNLYPPSHDYENAKLRFDLKHPGDQSELLTVILILIIFHPYNCSEK